MTNNMINLDIVLCQMGAGKIFAPVYYSGPLVPKCSINSNKDLKKEKIAILIRLGRKCHI